MSIKEFFLLKVAAALGVGPLMENWLGFDLIMY